MLSAGPFVFLKNLNCFFHFFSSFVCFAEANSNYWGGGQGIKINCFGKLLSRSDLITFYSALKLFKTEHK